MPSKQKIPNGALRFVVKDCHALAVDKDGAKSLQMTIYSGGVIENHWYWGRKLAIDLDGLKFTQGKYPILENHMQSKKIAFTGKPIVDNALKVDPDKTTFVSTPESDEFQRLSAEGFPYQASMYALPVIVERIEERGSAKVNGMTLKGPAVIWREAIFQEASICVFGWDTKTESKAFSKDIMTEVEFEEIGGDNFTTDTIILNVNEKEVKEMPKTV